ncbi:MAG TPA: TetR/AcrR family transcriptional regulator [Acidimicrobiales bacterium]|nr:TetR/AcrR family transcriptional regulator [Acidimicrobiales bacterium]
MPKRVDHEQRRGRIIEALWRIAADRGLHAVSFREVSAEAGVSVSLIQYYFETRHQLVLSSLEALTSLVMERSTTRPSRSSRGPAARRRLEAVLSELLPVDEERRRTMLLFKMYESAALTDPQLAAVATPSHARALQRHLADQLRQGQRAGAVRADVKPDLEASALVALAAGLGSTVLGNLHSPRQALTIVKSRLDRLFT